MMTLVTPEILKECLELSQESVLLALAIGFGLWLMGGWGHRFCIVLVTTLIAGIFGLRAAPVWGMQPLVAGLLLAVAAGALALSLARVLIFFAIGAGAVYLFRAVVPTWNEPVAIFVGGGLVGILLFRFWIMAVASLAGTLLITYSILCILARHAHLEVVDWADKNSTLLTWTIVGVSLLGVLLQLFAMRRPSKTKNKYYSEEDDEDEEHGDWDHEGRGRGKGKKKRSGGKPPPRTRWLRWMPLGSQKRAG